MARDYHKSFDEKFIYAMIQNNTPNRDSSSRGGSWFGGRTRKQMNFMGGKL
jgi:hypothetical protein